MVRIVASGKRKTAVARAVLTEGKGKVTVNGKDYKNMELFDKLRIEEPLRIAENLLRSKGINFDAVITARGGGKKGQTDAVRVALARAISDFAKNKELTEAFLDYDRNMLVADVRRKEAYKPNDSKARSKRQSSKR